MRRAYLILAFLLPASLAGLAEARAALAPNYQRLAELRAILEDPAVIAAFGVAPIDSIARVGPDSYLVASETCEVPVRIAQAALGAEVAVPTLEGEVSLSVPPETQSGQAIHMRGRGVRSVRSGRAGDLICRIVVETPVQLTREQRELLEQLDASMRSEDAAQHSPRAQSFLDGVKSLWSRVTS